MARSGPVKTAAEAAPKYQAGVSGGGSAWNKGIQQCPSNPMALASAQAPKAIANYTDALRPGGEWVTRMSQMPVIAWKGPSTAKQSKYTGSAPTAATKWSAWWQARGQGVAQEVRDTAALQRSQGMSPIDRAATAITMMTASSRRRGGG